MTLEETGDMEDVRLSISVQVLREDELNKTESPERMRRRPRNE
ncbi:MAG: hypothetical protein ACLS6G_11575 [Christensenellales bacterium]